jgi:hypothetical protein
MLVRSPCVAELFSEILSEIPMSSRPRAAKVLAALLDELHKRADARKSHCGDGPADEQREVSGGLAVLTTDVGDGDTVG